MMRLAGVVSVFAASQASAGWDSVVTIVGPETLRPGETVTLEVWAEITHPAFVPGQSAIAGFGFDISSVPGSDPYANIGNVRFDAWASDFGVEGVVSGLDIIGISGGQLANLFGILNPEIDLSNPIRMFTFDVTAGEVLGAEYAIRPSNPNPNGPLTFYPDHMDGDWITMLPRFVGWGGTVVPGQGTALVFGTVCWPWLLRRRGVRRPGGVDSKRRPRCD